jgi:hypothetical protein
MLIEILLQVLQRPSGDEAARRWPMCQLRRLSRSATEYRAFFGDLGIHSNLWHGMLAKQAVHRGAAGFG